MRIYHACQHEDLFHYLYTCTIAQKDVLLEILEPGMKGEGAALRGNCFTEVWAKCAVAAFQWGVQWPGVSHSALALAPSAYTGFPTFRSALSAW